MLVFELCEIFVFAAEHAGVLIFAHNDAVFFGEKLKAGVAFKLHIAADSHRDYDTT